MLKNCCYFSLSILVLLSGNLHASVAVSEYDTIDLGTLLPDNSKNSLSYGISADGNVIAGVSATTGSTQAFRYDLNTQEMIGLGSLRSDNAGSSNAVAISADGRVIVGVANTDSNTNHAFRHNAGDSKMTDLGTLKSDNSGESEARAVSADGRVVVGMARADKGMHAFRHNEGDARMVDLGTLTADNSGYSNALAVSADGRVVVGNASVDYGMVNDMHAFRHNEGDAKMIDLGTLKSDNTGGSNALAVSADGRVVVGLAETDQSSMGVAVYQAFRHNEGDGSMTGLGTLNADNTGSSQANAVSSDGRVVVGKASIGFDAQAFRHNDGDGSMTGLGTLKSDNTGLSEAVAVSADGRVVVGYAEVDSDTYTVQAFRHNEGDEIMTALGTLRADNTGSSYATGVSADGSVVVGTSEDDFGENRAVVWKTTKAVDVENTYRGMSKTASKASEVMDLYQNILATMAANRCQIGEDNYCMGAYGQYNDVRQSNSLSTGLYGSVRLPDGKWVVGGIINLADKLDLVNHYNVKDTNFPGIALHANYQENEKGIGFNVDLGVAYMKHGLSISREGLYGSEAGKGDSKIKGYLGTVKLGYGIALQPSTQLTPIVGVQHYNIKREGYSENRNADFLARYDSLTNKSTDLQLGLNLKKQLSERVALDAEVGSYINLSNQRDDFKVKMDYFGAREYQPLDTKSVKQYAQVGASFAISKHSIIRASLGWSETDYRKDATHVGMSYSYHF